MTAAAVTRTAIYWITGRVDDVLNVSGSSDGDRGVRVRPRRRSKQVAEAAVVGYPHEVKGQGVYAYVVPQPETRPWIPRSLNAGVPGSRSAPTRRSTSSRSCRACPRRDRGKVMRRILRKIAEGRGDELGDVSTLADPSVVTVIREGAVLD